MVNLMEVYKSLPALNCGKCKVDTCMGFASKLLKGDAKIADCTPILEENFASKKADLETMLAGRGKSAETGIIINEDRCTGCGNCAVACHMENNVPFREDESDKSRNIAWLRIYKVDNGAEYPHVRVAFFPRPCMQCDHHTPCVSVCPASATNYDELTGLVDQINTRCIGCRYCMAACPYMVRCFNWWDPVWPADMKEYLNPSVSVRMRGVVEKCSFCFQRYQQAKDKAFLEGRRGGKAADYQTACV